MAKLQVLPPDEIQRRAAAGRPLTTNGVQWLGGSGPGVGGGVGFAGNFGPGAMPAGVPGQQAFGYQNGPNPVFGSGGLPTGAPPTSGGGGFSLPSLGGFGDLLETGGRWLLNNPEVPLAVVGAIQGHQAQRDANKNDQRALQLLEQRQAQLAPLANAGIAGLMGGMAGGRPDLGFLVDRANPYAAGFAPVGRMGGGGSAPASTRSRRG